MQTSFPNNGYISKNGKQSSLHREHAIHSSVKRGSILNPKTSHQRMEAKFFLTVLSWIGFGSYIGGILLNLTNWKADILFLSGCGFILLKFIRLTVKTWQSYKREEIEQQILKRKINDSEG
jgi:hypothetical protein